jgi:hypothetical protein
MMKKGAMTFEELMQQIDPHCEVSEDTQNMAIRIRPSRPQYRDQLIKAALQHRPIGVRLNVVREVDDWIVYRPETLRQKIKRWWKDEAMPFLW